MKIDVILFGAGGTLFGGYIEAFQEVYNVLFVCDNDKTKWGMQEINGYRYEVMAPLKLKEYTETPIFVTSKFWKEIIEQCYSLGCKYVFSPMADYPLKTDPKCFYDLKKHIDSGKKVYIGNRMDFNYNKYAKWVYCGWNNHFVIHNMMKSTMDRGLLRRDMKILDYGCGVGTMGLSALLRGYDFYGIEIEKWKKEYIDSKIDSLGYPNEWKDRFILYDGSRIPFEDGVFDAVYTYQVMEHVRDVNHSVAEILRVCNDEGFVFIRCPNYDRSYEEHFMIEFGKPLRGNKEEFKVVVKNSGADYKEVDYINFVNKDDIRMAINKVGDYIIEDILKEDSLSDVAFIVKRNKLIGEKS